MTKILLTLSILFYTLASFAMADDKTFEKTFQKAGQSLDKAATKTKEFAKEAKEEVLAVTEKTEAKTQTWGGRIKGAAQEFGLGVKRAWRKITGKPEGAAGGEAFE